MADAKLLAAIERSDAVDYSENRIDRREFVKNIIE